jgi:hypothetical protein
VIEYQFKLFNLSFKPRGNCCASPTLGATLRRYVTLALALALLTSAAYGGMVSCANSSGDPAAIQSAINAGGTVTISGTCALGGQTIYINNAIIINGPATINGNQSQIFSVNADNVTINGLTIQYGYVGSSLREANTLSGFNFTNNTIQHLYSKASNGAPMGLNTNSAWNNCNITGNTFFDIWDGGAPYPNSSNPPPFANSALVQGWGHAALKFWSINNTSISNNVFSEIGNDAIAGSFEATMGNTGGHTTSGNVIAYNQFDHVRRIPIEIQSVNDGICPGGCNYLLTPTTGLQVKGNFARDYSPYSFFETWGASLVPDGAVGSQYINNTFIANPGSFSYGYGGYAACMESSGRNNLVQGNVCASVAGAPNKFGSGIAMGGGSGPSFTSTYQNNLFCGNPATTTLSHEVNPAQSSTVVWQYNYLNGGSCPAGANLTASNIAAAFTGNASVSGSNQTWNVSVLSNLSLRYVQFFVDASTTPAVTQELSDVNTNFAADHKWLYHLTLGTTGSHMITAKVTDVSGATQTITQGVGTGPTVAPLAQLAPTNVSFGSQTMGLGSPSQSVTLSNAGTSALNVSGIAITGSNSADFAKTSTCGSSLAAGASCVVQIIFTPSVAGSETASLSISDNASGSPQTAAVNGTGMVPSGPVPPPTPTPTPSSLPTNLPKGMMLWLANNAGVVATGSAVNLWEDQSGNANNAVQSIGASAPVLVNGGNGQQALRFNGSSTFMSISSLPIDGLTGMAIFTVSSCSADTTASYGTYPLLNWPETAYWGATFFGTYRSFSEFRFGTMQVGNENNVSMAFNRTNSFGLNEWTHSGATDSMFLNGQTVTTLTGKSPNIAGVGMSAIIGRQASSYYPGDVSEIIVYNRALSTAERQAVEQYLMTKYHL